MAHSDGTDHVSGSLRRLLVFALFVLFDRPVLKALLKLWWIQFMLNTSRRAINISLRQWLASEQFMRKTLLKYARDDRANYLLPRPERRRHVKLACRQALLSRLNSVAVRCAVG
jgi:hypothetical protein